ncbi:hypothetical protein PYCC9005_005437 [Savitreella phatthalungensis]
MSTREKLWHGRAGFCGTVRLVGRLGDGVAPLRWRKDLLQVSFRWIYVGIGNEVLVFSRADVSAGCGLEVVSRWRAMAGESRRSRFHPFADDNITNMKLGMLGDREVLVTCNGHGALLRYVEDMSNTLAFPTTESAWGCDLFAEGRMLAVGNNTHAVDIYYLDPDDDRGNVVGFCGMESVTMEDNVPSVAFLGDTICAADMTGRVAMFEPGEDMYLDMHGIDRDEPGWSLLRIDEIGVVLLAEENHLLMLDKTATVLDEADVYLPIGGCTEDNNNIVEDDNLEEVHVVREERDFYESFSQLKHLCYSKNLKLAVLGQLRVVHLYGINTDSRCFYTEGIIPAPGLDPSERLSDTDLVFDPERSLCIAGMDIVDLPDGRAELYVLWSDGRIGQAMIELPMVELPMVSQRGVVREDVPSGIGSSLEPLGYALL